MPVFVLDLFADHIRDMRSMSQHVSMQFYPAQIEKGLREVCSRFPVEQTKTVNLVKRSSTAARPLAVSVWPFIVPTGTYKGYQPKL